MTLDREQLTDLVEELVWAAWDAGMRSGSPMCPARQRDEEHTRLWTRLQELKEALDNLR